jgi:hypothetical protein
MQGKIRAYCLIFVVGAVWYSSYQAAWASGGEHREFELGDFALETGITLPQAGLFM